MLHVIAAYAGGRRLCTSWPAVFNRSISVGHSVERLQRLCQRLEQLQGRVKCPRLESFTVGDETFQLPMNAISTPTEPPDREELEYLVGFFDGDGSVSLHKRTGSWQLQVDQNVDSAVVLLRYQRAFGGTIRRSYDATGRAKACLKWQIHGANGRQAAEWLGSIRSMKQPQLQTAQGGPVSSRDRDSVRKRLAELRRPDFEPFGIDCSWPYFAGFFDADGSIGIDARYPTLSLNLSQMCSFGLPYWFIFLLREGLPWQLRSSRKVGSSTLACSHTGLCKSSLELLLQNGLLVKKEQAELALTLTATNHKDVREAVSKLKGNQGRYLRLDAAGMDRSRQIKLLGEQLRSQKCQQSKQRREEELKLLREEHARQNLVCKANALRFNIRQHFREGATILPLCATAKSQRSTSGESCGDKRIAERMQLGPVVVTDYGSVIRSIVTKTALQRDFRDESHDQHMINHYNSVAPTTRTHHKPVLPTSSLSHSPACRHRHCWKGRFLSVESHTSRACSQQVEAQ